MPAGRIFLETRAPEGSTKTPADAKRQMEEAMMRVVEKRTGQDAANHDKEEDDE